MQVEDIKKALLLNSGKVSQVTKDVLSDFRKLKGVRAGCGKILLYSCKHGMRGRMSLLAGLTTPHDSFVGGAG